jgi:Polysaccharide pyruvyl transferase.
MKNIGILTFHFADNIGAVLNCYGLQKTLQRMGMNVSIINFVPPLILDHSTLIPSPRRAVYDFGAPLPILKGYSPQLVTRLINFPKNFSRKIKFENFRKNFLSISYPQVEKLNSSDCNLFDACIVGSDQVWNPEYLALSNLGYLLPFSLQNTLKIAYAASVTANISIKQSNVFKKHLCSFSAVSVRESYSANELAKILGVDVQCTLDPTLLLNASDYDKILQECNVSIPDEFILVYNFGPFINNKIDKLAKKLSIEMGIPIFNVGTDLTKNYVAGPSEFIWLLKKASFVITNSYHVTLLSLKFKKKLLVIVPGARGMRLLDILKRLELEETVLNVKKPFEDIDYSTVEELLSKDESHSLEFLNHALKRS